MSIAAFVKTVRGSPRFVVVEQKQATLEYWRGALCTAKAPHRTTKTYARTDDAQRAYEREIDRLRATKHVEIKFDPRHESFDPDAGHDLPTEARKRLIAAARASQPKRAAGEVTKPAARGAAKPTAPRPHHETLSALLRSGKQVMTGRGVETVRVFSRRAALPLPSGKLVATDPFVATETTPLAERLPPAVYDVAISVVARAGRRPLVAAASVVIHRGRRVVDWSLALPRGVGRLVPAHLRQPGLHAAYGFGVDSGCGCLADEQVVRRLVRLADEDESAVARLWRKMNDARFTIAAVARDQSAKLVLFNTGYGDGEYPCYYGRDAAGSLICVMVDCGVATGCSP